MRARVAIRTTLVALMLLVTGPTFVAAEGYRKPTPQQAARVSLGQGLTGADLERVKIGNQGGILKVVDDAGASLFAKTRKGISGIDGREWAPLTPSSRDAILKSLGASDPGALASSLMSAYPRVSRAHALALLGALAYPGQSTPPLSAPMRDKVLQFLRAHLQPSEDNIVRRQAVLALAIQPDTDAQTVAAMLNFLRRDHNAWNTFGVVQFFEYQADTVRKMPEFQSYLTQLGASGSPHATQIARDLKTPAKPAADETGDETGDKASDAETNDAKTSDGKVQDAKAADAKARDTDQRRR